MLCAVQDPVEENEENAEDVTIVPSPRKMKSILVKMPQERNLKITFTCTSRGDYVDFNEAFAKVCSDDKLLCNQAHNFMFKTYDVMFNCMIDVTSNLPIEHGTIFEARSVSPLMSMIPVETTAAEVIQIKCEPFCYEDPILPTSSRLDCIQSKIDRKQTSSRTPKAQQLISNLKYPCPLPTFSHKLLSAMERNSAGKYYSMFTRECASYLLSLTPRPTKAEYNNFCRTISDHYPFVNDNFTALPYAAFKRMLCKCVRNMKYYSTHGVKHSNSTRKNSNLMEQETHPTRIEIVD